MRKKFKTNKKPKKPIKDTITVMPKEMRDTYNEFFGNKERLEGEWNLCCDQYDVAKKQSLTKEATFDARMMVRKVSNYWNNRKLALERVLEKRELDEFKKKRNEQKEINKDE